MATLMLPACAALKPKEENSPVPVEPLSPLFAFLATAEAGEVGTVEDPMTGATVRVIAGRRYHAASNRICRQFRVTSAQGYEGLNEGLACKDVETGRWTRAPLIINPDELSM